MAQKKRSIPFFLKIQVFFGHIKGYVGLGFLLIGGLGFYFYLTHCDWSIFQFLDSPQAEGRLTKIEHKGKGEEHPVLLGQPIWTYHFSFEVQKQTFENKSFDLMNHHLKENQKVTVFYLKNDPNISKIDGMWLTAYPFWVSLLFLPFFLVGSFFLWKSIEEGRKANRLLEFGEIAYGRAIYQQPTDEKINQRIVYEIGFDFEVHGKTYRTVARSHQPENILDEEFEKLVYNSLNPKESVIIDALPKVVKTFFLKSI